MSFSLTALLFTSLNSALPVSALSSTQWMGWFFYGGNFIKCTLGGQCFCLSYTQWMWIFYCGNFIKCTLTTEFFCLSYMQWMWMFFYDGNFIKCTVVGQCLLFVMYVIYVDVFL